MLDFWLAAGLLLLVALGFLLIPLMRGRGTVRHGANRTALNVALYQERMDELASLHAGGTLTGDQLEAGKAEAARELLADTEGDALPKTTRLGRGVPIAAALLVPLLGAGLYLLWGGSQQVEATRQLATTTPRTLEEMTTLLEQRVKEQPDSAESWYFLGRIQMGKQQYAEATQSFAQAARLAGRPPEVLGQLAQAQFFAGERQWSAEIQALTDEALKADPQEASSLGLLGIVAFEQQRFADAIGYWQRLLAVLPPNDAARTPIEGGIQRARTKVLEPDGELPALVPAALNVRVELAEPLRDKVLPDDVLFVFVKAASGPPMPLAVKRLRVADLPLEVSLSDADAMMPQLKLSKFPQVQLVARISRAGNATAGEWVGRGESISNTAAGVQQILIDSPDQL